MVEKLQKKSEELMLSYNWQLSRIADMKEDSRVMVDQLTDKKSKKAEAIKENQELKKLPTQLQESHDFLFDEVRSLDKKNAKRAIARRDRLLERKYDELQEQQENSTRLEEINKELEDKLEIITSQMETTKKRLYDKVYYYKKKSETVSQATTDMTAQYTEKITSLRVENSELQCQIEEIVRNDDISTFQNGRYTDEVRLVCYDLLSHGIGTNHISDVIRKVLKTLAGTDVGRLPKPTLVKYMTTQSGLLAKAVAVSAIESSEGFTTLHSDGTSRQNQGMRKKYVNYLVSTSTGTVATGLQDHHSADTAAQLEGTKTMFADLLHIHKGDQAGKGIRINQLVYKNKNLMQDRSSVMKNFAQEYETWRESVLPAVVDNWEDLDVQARENMAKVNDAYCLVHPILTFQEVADKAMFCFGGGGAQKKLCIQFRHGKNVLQSERGWGGGRG